LKNQPTRTLKGLRSAVSSCLALAHQHPHPFHPSRRSPASVIKQPAQREAASHFASTGDSASRLRYSFLAWAYAARVSANSTLAINRSFWLQHWSTESRHHCVLRFEVRTSLPSTTTHTGLVCELPNTRITTQLLRSIGTSKLTSLTSPSATIFLRATNGCKKAETL
jgi:hypothetical protein